jgi:hypothetical protein
MKYAGWAKSFLRWWTLENVSSSFDVLLKFGALFAALAALNIFVARPIVTWVEFCAIAIDQSRLVDVYAKAGENYAVQQRVSGLVFIAKTHFEECPTGLGKGVRVPHVTFKGGRSPFEQLTHTFSPLRWPGDPEGDYYEAVTSAFDSTEELFAYQRRSIKSMYIQVELRFQNSGYGRAEAVDIIPPPGYAPSLGFRSFFDLPANSTHKVFYSPVNQSVVFQPGSFDASWQTPAQVSRWLLLFGVALACLWLFLVVRRGIPPPAGEEQIHGQSNGTGRGQGTRRQE